MATSIQSGDPGREETPPHLREDLRRRRPRTAATTEFGMALAELSLAQSRIARLFSVSPRHIRRWSSGDRRVPHAVSILLRLLTVRAITIDQVEAAAPVLARANGGAKPEPPAPLLVASAPTRAALVRAEVAAAADSSLTTTAEKVYRLNGCRWPLGDPQDRDFRFCGDPVIKPPYCECHRALAYLAARPGGRHGVRIGFIAHRRQPTPAQGRPSTPGAFSTVGASRAPKLRFDRAGDLPSSAPPPA